MSAQQTSHGVPLQEFEDDNLEVVGLDYLVKSQHEGNRPFKQEIHLFRNNTLYQPSCQYELVNVL